MSPLPLCLCGSVDERTLKKEWRDPAGRSSHRYRYPPVYIRSTLCDGLGASNSRSMKGAKMKRKSCIQLNLFFLDNVNWNQPRQEQHDIGQSKLSHCRKTQAILRQQLLHVRRSEVGKRRPRLTTSSRVVKKVESLPEPALFHLGTNHL